MIIIFSSCQSLVHPTFMSCDVLEMDYFTDHTSLFTFLWGCLLNIKGKVIGTTSIVILFLRVRKLKLKDIKQTLNIKYEEFQR